MASVPHEHQMCCVLCINEDLARMLTYQDFPNHFIIKASENNPLSKVWHRRQWEDFAIGWMVYIGPTAEECFHLKTLLMVTKGPQLFDDLKMVNGALCETFHDTCLKLGLLEDNGEWEICLWDAAEIQSGSQLQHLFMTLLLFCSLAQPNELWTHFRGKICDNLRLRLYQLGHMTVTEYDIYDFSLHLIDNILHDSGHALPSMP